jgi:hypothetical protein
MDDFSSRYTSSIRRLSDETIFAFEMALSLNDSHRIMHVEFADTLSQLRAFLSRGMTNVSDTRF